MKRKFYVFTIFLVCLLSFSAFGYAQFTLTINIDPPAMGTVTRTPEKAFYDSLEVVTLTAFPIQGYVFDHWIGQIDGADQYSPSITIDMYENKTITANFAP